MNTIEQKMTALMNEAAPKTEGAKVAKFNNVVDAVAKHMEDSEVAYKAAFTEFNRFLDAFKKFSEFYATYVPRSSGYYQQSDKLADLLDSVAEVEEAADELPDDSSVKQAVENKDFRYIGSALADNFDNVKKINKALGEVETLLQRRLYTLRDVESKLQTLKKAAASHGDK